MLFSNKSEYLILYIYILEYRMSALIDARNKINECLLDNYNAGFK